MAEQNSLTAGILALLTILLWTSPPAPAVYAANAITIHAAAKQGDIQTLRTLITNKTDINQQDSDGWTPLMHAVKAGDGRSIDVLLKAGALPNIKDKLGRTAIELAVNGPISITRQLIKAGADPNMRNSGGITAIMMAAAQGRRDQIELLQTAGARVDYKDYQGNSILDWSARSGNTKLTNYLKQRLEKELQIEAKKGKKSDDDFDESKYADAVHPKWFKHSFLDLDEDLNEALAKGKKGLLVYFGLKRCSYCQAFMDKTLAKSDIEQRLRSSFDAVGMSIFSDNEMTDPTGKTYVVKDFVTLKKANFSPTMIFYGPGGRELLKIVGYYPPKKFRLVLDYLEGEFYNRETLHTYINRHQSATKQAKTTIQKDKLFANANYNLLRKTKPAQRPLVVLFEQPGCDACDRFHQRVLTDKPIRRLLGQFDTLQLDATDTKTTVLTPGGSRVAAKTWYNRLGLNYSPALVFFDENGKEIMRLDSETKRWRMEGTLQLILEKSYTKDTQVQRWRREKAVMFYNQQARQ